VQLLPPVLLVLALPLEPLVLVLGLLALLLEPLVLVLGLPLGLGLLDLAELLCPAEVLGLLGRLLLRTYSLNLLLI